MSAAGFLVIKSADGTTQCVESESCPNGTYKVPNANACKSKDLQICHVNKLSFSLFFLFF